MVVDFHLRHLLFSVSVLHLSDVLWELSVAALGWPNGNRCAKHQSLWKVSLLLLSFSAIAASEIWLDLYCWVGCLVQHLSLSPIFQGSWPESDTRNWTVNRSTVTFFQGYQSPCSNSSPEWTLDIVLGNIYHPLPLNSSKFHSFAYDLVLY